MVRILIVLSAVLLSFFCSCVVGFANSQNHVPSKYSKIYLPAANDTSIYSGNSSRLSFAVRRVLANRNDIQLTSLQEARLALQIHILDRQQSIVAVDNCRNASGTPTVASGAFLCTKIHPELTGGNASAPTSFNQPSISPKQENMALVVQAKIFDLNTGQLLWSKIYDGGTLPAVVFDEIGDNGDGRTTTYMAQTPGLHALRYQEAVDNAVESYSRSIASDLAATLFPYLAKME
jgi:hypothetical protein